MHMNFDPSSPSEEEINFDQFLSVDIRIGTILEVEDFPEARKPSFIVTVDFGQTLGFKTTSAQITDHYTKQELIGKQVAGVVNFPVKKIGKIKSEFLLLGFADKEQKVVLFQLDHLVPNGSRLH